MEHVLTISSDEPINDPRWSPVEDYNPDAPDELPPEILCPTGISAAYGGNLYLFLCRKCSPWRTVTTVQS